MMNKYIRAIFCIAYSLLRFCIIKLFHIKDFKFYILNLISPFVDISIGRKATLILGKMVRIQSGSKIKIKSGAYVSMGNNTCINHGCMIVSHEKITIGHDVRFGPNVLIYDHDHDFKAINGLNELKYKTSPVVIGDNVWIGANTVILRGTCIGDNCVVGAGSVLNGKYLSNTIIVQKRETTVIDY